LVVVGGASMVERSTSTAVDPNARDLALGVVRLRGSTARRDFLRRRLRRWCPRCGPCPFQRVDDGRVRWFDLIRFNVIALRGGSSRDRTILAAGLRQFG
jgi:hypothetical protein